MRTNATHIAGSEVSAAYFQLGRRADFEVRLTGNGLDLEAEMLKVAANQMDYQAATALFARARCTSRRH